VSIEVGYVTIFSQQWYRFRFVANNAKGLTQTLTITPSIVGKCKFARLAADGVYRFTIPETADTTSSSITHSLPAGGRVDYAVYCSAATVSLTITYGTFTLGTLDVQKAIGGTHTPYTDNELQWTPYRPNYLSNLAQVTASEQNKQTISVSTLSFTDDPLYTYTYGSVVEWTITGSSSHPFHLHVNHMQIVTSGGCSGGYLEGEYYDTISTSSQCKVRFRLSDFAGELVFHCHNLEHSDSLNMMAWAVISDGPQQSNTHASPFACLSGWT
jgi:hypothetical protein